jgi:hypothetical protein
MEMAKNVASLYEAFGNPRDGLAAAADKLRDDGLRTAAAKSKPALRLAAEEIRGALEDMLRKLDLVQLAARAWVTLEDLQKYRDRGKYPPDVATVVSLAEHTVRSEHHPRIELLLNGKTVTSLELDLEFAAVFEGLALTVQDARICRVGTGRCRAEVSLSYKDNELWSQESPNVALPGTIDLGKGFEIPAI